jgi:major membrane immunogen (membrane-anchored lipoprotein)
MHKRLFVVGLVVGLLLTGVGVTAVWADNDCAFDRPGTYRIRVKDYLDGGWSGRWTMT